MSLFRRHGPTPVLAGWPAWLGGLGVCAATAARIALIAFLMLGIAITVTAVLFIVVPVAIGVALIASLFRPST